MEVPKPSYTAELFQPAPNNCPGPVIGSGEGSSIVYTQASIFKLIVISALKLSSLIALIMMLTLRHQTNFARAIDLHKHRPRCFVIILRPICNIRFLLTRDAQHLAQVPTPPSTVEFLQSAFPYPVVGCGEEVFQPVQSGKYGKNDDCLLPDISTPSSLRIYYQNVRGLRQKSNRSFLLSAIWTMTSSYSVRPG